MGFIPLLRPSISVTEIASTLRQAVSGVAALLQSVREPALPLVPLITTHRGESWYTPAPRQAYGALLMLLSAPDGLHPRLQSALLAIVVAHWQHLTRDTQVEELLTGDADAKQPPGVFLRTGCPLEEKYGSVLTAAIKALTAALGRGCTLEQAYDSVLTSALRDAVWQGGPYAGVDPASNLLLNHLAVVQGMMIERDLNSGKNAYTDYQQLPERFVQQQASLEDRLSRVEPQAFDREQFVQYRQLNQWLHRHEWSVQLPVGVAQQISHWLLRHCLPSTAVARQLSNYCQGQVSAQALGENWQANWSQLQQASTFSQFLEGVNKALEQGVLTPVTVLYGLSNLYNTAVPLIPVSLMVAAMVGWGQDTFAGQLSKFFGSPSSEIPRILQELGRLNGNCASLMQCAQSASSSLPEWLNPASVPLGTTQAVDNPGARAQRNADQHLLEQGGAQRWGHDLPPGVTEPPATSNGARPTGIMQAAQYVAQRVVSGTVSLLWKTSSSDVCEKTDVETPLCQASSAVYQPTTAPIAAAGQHWPALGTGLGIVAASTVGGAGTYALYQAITANPDPRPGSEPVFAPPPLHEQILLYKLKNHWHIGPGGTLMSSWEKLVSDWETLRTSPAAPDANAQQVCVSTLLYQDFGPSLAPLLGTATPGFDADFEEFDALEDPAPVRHRRALPAQAGTGPQAARQAVVEEVIALLDQPPSREQQEDQRLQQERLRELQSDLPAEHWLHAASADEQALWLTTVQTQEERYERLAELKYDSLRQFETQRQPLQPALAEAFKIELQRAVLESKFKGYLSGDSYIPGLQVMTAALNDDPQVEVGSLQLSVGEGADAVLLTLPQLLVFTLRDARGAEAGVVLYRPEERRVQPFSSQQEMFQHLDHKRMRQSLHAEVQPPATPGPAASRPASQAAPDPALKPLPELALEAALPSQRAVLRRAFAELGQRPDAWTPEHLPVRTYPGASLQAKLEDHAAVWLDREQARLQRLDANPELARLSADAAHSEQQTAAFIDEYLPTLRAFTWRNETRQLTKVLRKQGGLASNATVDADAVLITFNHQTLSWTDWVLEGYRKHGDNPFASSNNFLADARFKHEDPAVVQALGSPGVKQSVQQHLRASYAGDQYVKYLEQWREPNDLRGKKFGELKTALIEQQLRGTLEQARVDGMIDSYTAAEFKTLLDGLPTVTVTGTASLQTFQVDGRRIPEVLVLSLRQRATGLRTAEARRSDYVFLQGPYGLELLKLSDYQRLITTPGAYYDDLLARTLIRDKTIIDAVQRGQRDTGVASAPITDFTQLVGDQWLQDGIDNIREATTSRHEVIAEQMVKGLRGAAGGVCIAGSLGTAVVSCGALTLGLSGYDISNAVHHFKRGQLNEGLEQLMFLGLDGLDVAPALRIGGRALMRSGLLRAVDKWRPNSPSEVLRHSTAFTPLGLLNDALACSDVPLDQLQKLPSPPGKAADGTFYNHEGKVYITSLFQNQRLVYEVKSDNAWATVRVRDPLQPHGPGEPVHYRDDHWRADKGGLRGGGVGASSPRSPEQLQEFLQLFNLIDHQGNLNAGIHNTLKKAFLEKTMIPRHFNLFLRDRQNVSQVFGLLGVLPPTGKKIDSTTGKTLLKSFDFSTAPKGHTLGQWLAYDWRKSAELERRRAWPIWAVKYSRSEAKLDLYSALQLLSVEKEAFPSEDIARAYLRQFDVLDPMSRNRLIANRVHGHDGPDFIEQFPERARVRAKIQILARTADFADEKAARNYLRKFSFPNTNDGQILKMALLSDRIEGGRTPVWAGEFLEHQGWKRYKVAPRDTNIGRERDLHIVLNNEGMFSHPSQVYAYMYSFKTIDDNGDILWDLREELVLDKLLERDRRPVWAFMHAVPSAVMTLYKSEDIPANLKTLKVILGEGCETHVRLPEDMPTVLNIDIQALRGAASGTEFTVTLPQRARQLNELKFNNVRFRLPSVQLNAKDMPELKKLTITACSETKSIDLREMSNLQRIDISSNAQLSDFHTPEVWSNVRHLRISGNPRLSLGARHIPRQLPELRTLLLENNNLREDLSVMETLHAQNLQHLDLRGNHLHDLTPLSGFEHLDSLELASNDFTTIPASIMDLSPRVNVNLLNNRFSDRIQRQYEDAMAAPGYSGPRLRFVQDDDSAVGLARPTSDAVSAWYSPGEGENEKALWLAHDHEVHAQQFSAYLDRLHRSRSSDIEVFKEEVPALLKKLRTDDDLRERMFLLADQATATCDDRVSLIYNKMQELELLSDVTKGNFDNTPDTLKLKLLNLFRLQKLDKFAQIFINKAIHKNEYIDEIEVYLALREQLHQDLDLPGKTSHMLYLPSSRLQPADFADAKAYVLDNEKKTNGGFDSYLLNSEAMREVLKRQFPQEYEQASEHLNELILDTETGDYAKVRAAMLADRGLSVEDADAVRNVEPAVMESFYKKFYGPLMDRFFKPAR
ncbi:hypothetical protein EQV97_18855 [Pseudomonas sp. TMW22090]|uniref:NEL-type E3 ubiquitin ligase domain-containing protein n=1 Tax=Pseudomonas sp. TMW22090 TaxID=2506434 RepID=UPI001F0EDE9E|nr:NEL-type E3 ubiquitin ligase domain-containing protein [Pseudomonas sp. TMW22090]MCH4879426.1 hypothetical protein [Pseudomonas sp. TMW22090]